MGDPADMECHRLLKSLIEERFPDLPVVMEEQANPSAIPASCIVADELDGTHVYMSGSRDWGVTLALIEDGRPAAGILLQPATGVSVRTARGFGTWFNDRLLKLDGAELLDSSVIGAEINRQLRWEDFVWVGALANHCASVRCLATSVGSALELIRGSTALFVNPRGGKIWDFAAAALAVEEASGIATSVSGEPLCWSTVDMGVVLAANHAIAEQALSLRVSASEAAK